MKSTSLNAYTRTSISRRKIKFEALFQYVELGIMVVNQKAEIILANACVLSLFDYPDASELIGKKIEYLIPRRFHH